MVNVFKFARDFLMDCRGASGAEYALVLFLVGSIAMFVVVLGVAIVGAMDGTSGIIEQAACGNNGQGTGDGGGNGGGGGQGGGNGSGNSC